jgi:hypothetical protein
VTILARIAGLFILVIGLVWGAIGGLAIAGGVFIQNLIDRYSPTSTTPDQVTTAGNVVGGAVAALGIVIVIFAVIEILGGLGALLGKTFGRIIGILYSLVFGLFLLLIISAGVRDANTTDTTADVGAFFLIFVAMFVMYLYSFVVLIARWRRQARA